MKLYKIQWPTAAVLIAGLASTACIFIFADPEALGSLLAANGGLWTFLAAVSEKLLKADR